MCVGGKGEGGGRGSLVGLSSINTNSNVKKLILGKHPHRIECSSFVCSICDEFPVLQYYGLLAMYNNKSICLYIIIL